MDLDDPKPLEGGGQPRSTSFSLVNTAMQSLIDNIKFNWHSDGNYSNMICNNPVKGSNNLLSNNSYNLRSTPLVCGSKSEVMLR